MGFKIVALDMVTPPNYYKEATQWEMTAGNASRFWFQLQIEDSLGTRRYIPLAGSTVKLEFTRIRTFDPLAPVSQTIQKNTIQNADDRSLFYTDISATDSQNILSGSVKVTLTEGGISNSFIQNYFVNRKSCVPGN
jgi:hypothetical protein